MRDSSHFRITKAAVGKKKGTQGDSGLPIVQGYHDSKAPAVSELGAQGTVVLATKTAPSSAEGVS